MTGSRPGPLRVDIGWIPLLQDLNSVYADEIAVASSVSTVQCNRDSAAPGHHSSHLSWAREKQSTDDGNLTFPFVIIM